MFSLPEHISLGNLFRTKQFNIVIAILASGICSFSSGADANPLIVANVAADHQRTQERKMAQPAGPSFVFGILGSFEFSIAKHSYNDDWAATLSRIRDEKRLYADCDRGLGQCPAKVKKWRNIINELKGLPQLKQATELNRSVNKLVRYVKDAEVFSVHDYWASPVEFLSRNGDCEDYAILKFVSLLELGFANDQLRIVIVRDRRRKTIHAVLAVLIGDKTYILDNLYNDAVEEHYVLKYVPIYSFNLDKRLAHVSTSKMRSTFLRQTIDGTVKTTMQLAVPPLIPRDGIYGLTLKSPAD